MENCLDNIIKAGSECEGSANMTLEEIGLLLPEIDQFVDGNYKNGRELAEAKIHAATHMVLNDVHAKFNQDYKLRTVLSDEVLGFYNDNCSVKENKGSYSGIEFEFCNNQSYIDVYVNEIILNLKFTGTSTLYVYNLSSGKKLDEFEFESVEGCEAIVNIDKVYKSKRNRLHLAFLINASEIESSYETSLKSSGCRACEGGSMARANKYINARGVYIPHEFNEKDIDPDTGMFVEKTDIIKKNIRGLNHTSGMTICYSCQCNHEDWICKYKNKLVFPLLYKAGEEILKYALYTSDCLNNKTTLDAEKMQLRVIEYKENYEKMLDTLVRGMKIPYDKQCFECDKSITHRISRP